MTQNTKKIHTDILIAGGGPAGLALACSLAGCGLDILLVDAGTDGVSLDELAANAGKTDFDARVSALTVPSQKLLESLGIWENIASTRACPYYDMQVWDGEGTGSIHFTAADIHVDCLGHIVENNLVAAALKQLAKAQSGLTLRHEDKVTRIALDDDKASSRAVASLASGVDVTANLLVGADGANSFVRQQGGFKTREWDYGQRAIVTTVKTALPHQFTAWQRFMHTGPVAFLPLYLPGLDAGAQCYSSIVWSCVTEGADGILALDDAAFRDRLGAAFEFRLGEILETDTRISFPLRQRHATDYVQTNMALVGDSAHTIHPLAGQGVNLGFADVQALSAVISEAIAKGEDYASHQVLSRYQRRRKAANLGMMAAMEGFKHLFASDDLALTWLRNAGLKLTDQALLVKHRLIRQAMGL
jgi:2-octaprenylphenol hydroxylase